MWQQQIAIKKPWFQLVKWCFRIMVRVGIARVHEVRTLTGWDDQNEERQAWEGRADNVKFIDHALTAEEVRHNLNGA